MSYLKRGKLEGQVQGSKLRGERFWGGIISGVSQRGRGLSHSLLFYNWFFYFYYPSSRTNVQSYLIDFLLFCDIPFDLHRWSKKGKQRDRAPGMNAFPIRATLLLSQGNVNVCTEDSPDRENGVRYHKSWYPGISTKVEWGAILPFTHPSLYNPSLLL